MPALDQVGPRPTEASRVASAAQNKMAEEALLADPAELKKVFSDNLAVLDPKGTGYVNQDQIRNGLSNPMISEQGDRMLNILNADYGMFSHAGDAAGQNSKKGISVADLSVIEKSMDKSADVDPVRDQTDREISDVTGYLGMAGGAAAGAIFGLGFPGMAVGAMAGDIAATVIGAGMAKSIDGMFNRDQYYETIANSYSSFVKDFSAK